VAGVHGLEHVEGLPAAALANDDAIGPHAQRIAHQIANGEGAFAFHIGNLVSRVTTCGWWSWSSAASSMVTMRSSLGMAAERILSNVVLPHAGAAGE